MSAPFTLDDLSAKQIAGLIELGIITLDQSIPSANGNAFTPSDAHVEAYKGWITPREAYTLLHPIAKKGSCLAKATLNYLPVAGTVDVGSLPKGWRGALGRGGVEEIGNTADAKGRAVTRTYGQRANADGRTMDGRAPAFFKAGGKLIIDELAGVASLRMPSGFSFTPENIVALKELA